MSFIAVKFAEVTLKQDGPEILPQNALKLIVDVANPAVVIAAEAVAIVPGATGGPSLQIGPTRPLPPAGLANAFKASTPKTAIIINNNTIDPTIANSQFITLAINSSKLSASRGFVNVTGQTVEGPEGSVPVQEIACG